MKTTTDAQTLNKLLEATKMMLALYDEYRDDIQTKEWGGYAEYMAKTCATAIGETRKALYETWLALDDTDPDKDNYRDILWTWDDGDIM